MISSIDLKRIAGEEAVLLNEPMAQYTTFGTGGPADLFIRPDSREQLKAVLAVLKESGTPCFILGRGSNLLVSDAGYRGAVITLRKSMEAITVDGTRVTAEAGAMMPEVALAALRAGLSGLEFASGIPGTIGGGLIMNAGAYGSELKNVVCEAEVLTPSGEVVTLKSAELDLSYRHSALMGTENIVLSVTMELTPGNPEQIRAVMDDLNKRRRDKQPLEYGSAGSTFKRPEGYYAGALIEEAGLKGFHVGNAWVSEKHAGFVVNKGGASAAEIMQVIRHVQQVVLDRSGVPLEPEVRLLGEFN